MCRVKEVDYEFPYFASLHLSDSYGTEFCICRHENISLKEFWHTCVDFGNFVCTVNAEGDVFKEYYSTSDLDRQF